jgi:hypothetical protein
MKRLLKVRNGKEYSSNWVTIALSAASFLLMILAGLGVITTDQSGQITPLISDTIQAASVVIAGVLQIINVLFKQPTE